MPVRFIDASALGALIFIFGEPKAEEIARTLGNSPVEAPALIWFKMASICAGYLKGELITLDGKMQRAAKIL